MSNNNNNKWIMQRLRRASMYWPEKVKVLKAAKVITQVGHYKNGKPKFRTFFKCNQCFELYPRNEVQVDHIKPILALDGFTDWNTYIERLFCKEDNLQCLCVDCHREKTKKERKK